MYEEPIEPHYKHNQSINQVQYIASRIFMFRSQNLSGEPSWELGICLLEWHIEFDNSLGYKLHKTSLQKKHEYTNAITYLWYTLK